MSVEKGTSWLDAAAEKLMVERKEASELTDAGNASRFVSSHGDNALYVPAWGWCVWDGKVWRRDPHLARKMMVATARDIHAEAAAEPDPAKQSEIAGWARKSQSASRIVAALYLAEPELVATPEQFDAETRLLPCANGTVDLRTGQLHPHRREHYATRLIPVCYSPNAHAPIWERFLRRVMPGDEERAFLQRAAGYSLTGDTGEQALFFLFGGGANGKSVFIETLASLIGEFHTATRIETLSQRQGGGIPNDIAALAGARVVTVSETPEGARMNESLIKDLTGGDTISARFMRREFFDFRPQFKLWIRGNHKPQIRGTDDGIWRRLILVPFMQQIPPSERDPALAEKLRDELPGILRWAVEGCIAWQRDGLNPPESMRVALSEYRQEMDLLGEFIDECTVVAPDAYALATPLYKAYQRWAEDNGHHPLNNTNFGRRLSERGFMRVKRGTYRWHGIGLKSDSGPLDGLDPSPSSYHFARALTDQPGAGVQTVQPSTEGREQGGL